MEECLRGREGRFSFEAEEFVKNGGKADCRRRIGIGHRFIWVSERKRARN